MCSSFGCGQWKAVLLAALSAGCHPGDKARTDPAGADSGSGGGGFGHTADDPPAPFHIEWTDSHIAVVPSESFDANGWSVGLCVSNDDYSSDWFGESCVEGTILDDGTEVAYCHSMQSDGLVLEFGGDRAALAPGTTAVPRTWTTNAQVTLFAPGWDFEREYWRSDSLDCFMFGYSSCGDDLYQYCQQETRSW